jgi:hypothetical protein
LTRSGLPARRLLEDFLPPLPESFRVELRKHRVAELLARDPPGERLQALEPLLAGEEVGRSSPTRSNASSLRCRTSIDSSAATSISRRMRLTSAIVSSSTGTPREPGRARQGRVRGRRGGEFHLAVGDELDDDGGAPEGFLVLDDSVLQIVRRPADGGRGLFERFFQSLPFVSHR